jgi:prepilin-type N-terminal cleavage/methylation domain-containing protein
MENTMISRIVRAIQNSRGFTLLEATLTMVVLGVGLTGSVMIFDSVNTTTMNGDIRVVASQLANEKIESILADKAFDGYDAVTSNAYANEQLDGDFTGYTRSVEIIEVCSTDLETPTVGSGIKQVNVTVSWGDEDTETLTISTLVANTTA